MTLKRSSLIALLLVIFLAACSEKKDESGSIKADLSAVTKDFDHVVVKMWGFENLGDSLKVSDTISAVDGKFEYFFRIKQPKYTNVSLLKGKKLVGEIGFKDKFCKKERFFGDIYIGNEDVFLEVNNSYEIAKFNDITKYRVDFEGSEEADMFMRIFNGFAISRDNLKSNPDSFALLEKLYGVRENCSLGQLKEYASLFSDQVKHSTSYHMLQEYISAKENLEKFGYRKKNMWVDIYGRSHNLKQAQNGRLLLLVFWASWCHPCRQEIPNLKKFYDNYKDKVSIVSLSIDDDYDRWKEAVEKEQMPWLNLSGLPKSKNEVKMEYNITTVPNMILLDSEGRTLINVYNDLPGIIKAVGAKQ